MEIELKPCPFCGGELRYSLADIDGWIAAIACDECDMRGPCSEWKYDDRERAKEDCVKRWRFAFPLHGREDMEGA